jgi:hypothetical protein
MFDQPFDGVVGIGAFVDILWSALHSFVRRHVYEVSFRHVTAAHVLVGEDECLAREFLRRSQVRLEVVHAVGTHAVGRAIEHDRVRPCGVLPGSVLGGVHGGEQLLPVAHRDRNSYLVCLIYSSPQETGEATSTGQSGGGWFHISFQRTPRGGLLPYNKIHANRGRSSLAIPVFASPIRTQSLSDHRGGSSSRREDDGIDQCGICRSSGHIWIAERCGVNSCRHAAPV